MCACIFKVLQDLSLNFFFHGCRSNVGEKLPKKRKRKLVTSTPLRYDLR